MPEPLKNLVGPTLIGTLADRIGAVHPAFPARAFVAAANDGLEALELKARVRHVAAALRPRLPEAWPDAVAVLVASLPPRGDTIPGMSLWPVLQVVEVWGVEDPAASLPALREMTSRCSAEFAIRPFVRRWPEQTWAALERWVEDPDEHVRRLVSEGTRPRLPWGERLEPDPRAIPLLERLLDDPSDYVRRSVANHLGDLAKIDAEYAVALATRWGRPDLVRHGLRDLTKRGHPGALALIGRPTAPVEVQDLSASDAVVGGETIVRALLRVATPAHVRVDLVWGWPGSRGWSKKTFRGADRALAAGETWAFEARLSTRDAPRPTGTTGWWCSRGSSRPRQAHNPRRSSGPAPGAVTQPGKKARST